MIGQCRDLLRSVRAVVICIMLSRSQAMNALEDAAMEGATLVGTRDRGQSKLKVAFLDDNRWRSIGLRSLLEPEAEVVLTTGNPDHGTVDGYYAWLITDTRPGSGCGDWQSTCPVPE